MAPSNKRIILTTILLAVLFIGGIIFNSLFPEGPILDPVPNPISDKTRTERFRDENQLTPNPQRNLYFGDLHVHTSLSLDAYVGGTLANPEDAYQFARGNAIKVLGKEVQIDRPLDFSAVTDHAEAIGELITVQNADEPGHKAILPRLFRAIHEPDEPNYSIHDPDNPVYIDTSRQRKLFNTALHNAGVENPTHPRFFRGYKTTAKAWDIILDAAEKFYEPGKFTTFAGYEWSQFRGRAHLHRNIIFRDMMLPDYPLSSFELKHEEALWTWLQHITDEGATAMAIPHNTNLADGGAFSDRNANGNPMTTEYAQLRQDFEPLIEIHQAKGSSEVHAAFWKNDEFAGFENYAHSPPQKNNYVRWALKKGLEHEHTHGVNPFKFGIIGSTDTHTATPGKVAENSNTGNNAIADFFPEARAAQRWVLDESLLVYEVVNPGGLVAVWAEENTRGYIYDALKQKECYATSGSRIQLRFFGGNGFKGDYNSNDALVNDGYANGVPMGRDLPNNTANASFLIWAKKDSIGAGLDRLQVVKGWHKDGELHEKIFNVALSDDRRVNGDGTVLDNGATVDLKTGAFSTDLGAEELLVVWNDPEFDPEAKAFYYVRVIEIPTASWQLWDQIRYGTQYPDHISMTVRERAWSSPIWYSPKS